jgi:hypothetical protein
VIDKPTIEDTWPAPAYDNGPPKHVHAIGVIALTYATLQSAMDCLFLNRTQSEWAEKYYYGLSEDKRSDAIREIFKDDDPSVVAAIGNIVKYFDWCRAASLSVRQVVSEQDGGGEPGDDKNEREHGSRHGGDQRHHVVGFDADALDAGVGRDQFATEPYFTVGPATPG